MSSISSSAPISNIQSIGNADGRSASWLHKLAETMSTVEALDDEASDVLDQVAANGGMSLAAMTHLQAILNNGNTMASITASLHSANKEAIQRVLNVAGAQ